MEKPFDPEDVVISGIGGYFPNSSNIGEFRQRLLANENMLSSRWKAGERGVTNKIGVVPAIDRFDTAYFGIHRQQATFMDPMQRLILERAFEALIDAGVNPVEVRGKRIGCYMGSSVGENDNLFYESIVSGFGVTGHSRAMLPNRVSYWLNLKGPSCAYDSNWVNGIEVLRLAYDAIKDGHCEAALIGTANLALNSELSWLYKDMGLLSDDGSTRAFDAEASGYARSDGVVVLFVQRACDAKRKYASVLNVSTCFNGNREGTLLDLDLPSMVEFISEFYSKTDVDPKEVQFVEAYGSGQKVVDKTELEALDQVYCKNRKSPLLVGSVKTNTGHSEASAAMFSIAKVLIAMEAGVIPANIQYEKPNPEIKPLVDGRVKVVQENTPWNPDLAAVNALGIDSYYSHALFKANPKIKKDLNDGLPRLVVASTRTEEGIKEILNTISNKYKEKPDPEYIALIQDLYSKPIPGHLYRGYVVLDEESKQETDYYQGSKRQLWFVYSGMGSQWVGMAKDLMQLPIFANSIQKCHKALVPKGIDLLKIITDTTDPNMFDNILHSFVGIAAVQIALTDVLKALGLNPDGIIGHSVGELGCAYCDGCFSAEQMMLCAYSRGKASLEADLIRGMMAAVGMGYQQIKDRVPPTIEVACHNGPDSSTISGPTEDMEKFVKQLQDEGIFARLVNVSNIAYHSRYIKPAAPYLLKYLKEVIPEPVARSSKWISTSNPESQWDTDVAKYSSAEYHTNNLLSSVLFEEGLKHIPKDSILIEIAPHGLLQAILKRSLKPGCTNVPLTQRGSKNGLGFLLSSLGKLYLAGLDLNLPAIFPPIEYPVSRGTPTLADLVHWEHSESWRTGLEDKMNYLVSVKDIQVTLNSEEFRDCVGHQLDDRIVLPVSSYLSIIIKILSISTAKEVTNVVIENLKFKKVLSIPKIGSVPVYAMIQKGSGEFEILSGDDIILTGKISIPAAGDKFLIEDTGINVNDDAIQLSGSDVYSEFVHRGHKYSGLYKSIKSLTLAEEGSIGVAQWNSKWTLLFEAMVQQVLFPEGERYQNILVPSAIQRIALSLPQLPADNNKQDLQITYDYYTKIVSTEGLQISGLVTKPLPLEKRPISYHSTEFLPLNGNYNKIENVINAALHMILEKFDEKLINNISITELESENESLIEGIKNVMAAYTQLNANVTTVKDLKAVILNQSDPVLILINDYLNDELAKTVANSHAFAITKTNKNIANFNDIIEVAQLSVRGIQYSIIRQSSTSKPVAIKVKGDTLGIKDLSRTNLSWVTELKSAILKIKNDQEKVYLVTSLTPADGIYNFSRELRETDGFSCVRTLFLVDKKAPEFSPSNTFYSKIFKQDLALTVVKDGVVGTFVPVPFTIKENITPSAQLVTNVIDQKNINYISVNLMDETILQSEKEKEAPVELGNIDYSGVTSSGQRVMGLARLDPETYKLVPDPILSWNIPEQWSLEDAVTIPHAYISAYIALVQRAKVQPGETVLIHAGCSAIGIAAISIAAVAGCTIYTTVSTDYQRAFLKKHFSFLKDRNILSSDSSNFEPQFLMATGGDGAHVVINCLSGNLLQAAVRCVASFGRFVQIGKFDLEENNTIGMGLFLRNTSFYGVILENVFDAFPDEKQELHDLIEKGMADLVVRPLYRKVVEHQNVKEILRSLRNRSNVGKIVIKLSNSFAINQFNVKKTTQFLCDSKNSYLIYGGSADLWVDMAEWLVLRGARKLVVSSDAKPQQSCINRRLALLQSYFNAEIIYAPSKAQTRDGAAELLSEVYLLGPIHAVFVLPGKSGAPRVADIKPVQYIDAALRATAPKAIMVNFISNAAGLTHLRAEAGFSTYNVQWESKLDFADALYALDDILSYRITDILIKNDKVSDAEQESPQALFKKLQLLLPTAVDELRKQAKRSPAKPEFIQLPTLGPRVMRELPPLFIIPGLASFDIVRDLANQLLYPVFAAVLPYNSMDIQEMAKHLAEKMKQIYPRGPYNIIGISWGGALAIEVTRILERTGASTLLYFIDGAPETIQAAIKHLGEGVNAEVNLLTRILNINNAEINKELSALPNWSARVKQALKHYPDAAGNEELIEKALTTIRDRIIHITKLQPTEELIAGPVHLLRPTGSSKYDNCGLLKYCKQTAQIYVVQGDHLSMVKSKGTADIVNEKVTVI